MHTNVILLVRLSGLAQLPCSLSRKTSPPQFGIGKVQLPKDTHIACGKLHAVDLGEDSIPSFARRQSRRKT
jgi:hypothetical protein